MIVGPLLEQNLMVAHTSHFFPGETHMLHTRRQWAVLVHEPMRPERAICHNIICSSKKCAPCAPVGEFVACLPGFLVAHIGKTLVRHVRHVRHHVRHTLSPHRTGLCASLGHWAHTKIRLCAPANCLKSMGWGKVAHMAHISPGQTHIVHAHAVSPVLSQESTP
jgi:hypothetical protein